MIQPKGWKDLTFDQPKVPGDVSAFGLTDDFRMTHEVEAVFVGPGIERGEIQVMQLFSVFHLMMKFDGIGATPVERVSGLESGDQVKGLDQVLQLFIVSLEFFPFALPHAHDTVTRS